MLAEMVDEEGDEATSRKLVSNCAPSRIAPPALSWKPCCPARPTATTPICADDVALDPQVQRDHVAAERVIRGPRARGARQRLLVARRAVVVDDHALVQLVEIAP